MTKPEPMLVGDVVRLVKAAYEKYLQDHEEYANHGQCDLLSFSAWMQSVCLEGLDFDRENHEYKVMLACNRPIDAIYYLGNLVRKNIIPIDHLIEFLK